jgi:predicted transcriptional regulator
MQNVRPIRVTDEKTSIVESVAEIFHRLNRVVPDNQDVTHIASTTTVSEALRLMKKMGYSQLPVLEGSSVLGIFSFRSLAEGVVRLGKIKSAIGDMPVEEFVEKVQFARVTDEFNSIFDWLERDGSVLLGEPERLQGIATTIDVLRYLYGVASPFVLITEIELALRALISVAVDETLLPTCARATLSSKYGEDKVPITVGEMEFNDYVQLVGHGDNWKYFSPVFGGMRETVRAKLQDIRDLRNDVFHFKRELTWEDHEKLTQYRDWVLMRARRSDAMRKEGRT